MRHPIVLFDGDCNFCRASVRWLVKHDPAGVLHYAPLESEFGKRLLRQHGTCFEQVESVVLVDRGRIYFKSEAVLQAVRHLQGPWRRAGILRMIPRPLRNFGYDLISHNRSVISRAVGTINRRYEPSGPERERFLAT